MHLLNHKIKLSYPACFCFLCRHPVMWIPLPFLFFFSRLWFKITRKFVYYKTLPEWNSTVFLINRNLVKCFMCELHLPPHCSWFYSPLFSVVSVAFHDITEMFMASTSESRQMHCKSHGCFQFCDLKFIARRKNMSPFVYVLLFMVWISWRRGLFFDRLADGFFFLIFPPLTVLQPANEARHYSPKLHHTFLFVYNRATPDWVDIYNLLF